MTTDAIEENEIKLITQPLTSDYSLTIGLCEIGIQEDTGTGTIFLVVRLSTLLRLANEGQRISLFFRIRNCPLDLPDEKRCSIGLLLLPGG
jgi:hypothetical protein